MIMGHFLPYRSEKAPNIKAPTERNIKVTVRPLQVSKFHIDDGSITHETSELDTPKSLAISVIVNDTVKKSKASQVQPRKPTMNISH